MKPVMQQIMHDPDNGQYGDCVRACIVSLLEVPYDDVPHFLHDGIPDGAVLKKRVRVWLRERGLTIFDFAFNDTVQNVLNSMSLINPGEYYMLGVGSPRADHCVVAHNDKVVHDPAGYMVNEYKPCSDGFVWVTVIGGVLP